MDIIKKIWNFWYPKNQDQEDKEYYALIIGCSYLMIFINFAYIVLNLNAAISPIPSIISIISNFVILFLLRYSSNRYIPTMGFLLILGGYIAFLVFMFRGFPFTILPWVPIYAIVSMYLVGKKLSGYSVFALSATIVGIIYTGKGIDLQNTQIHPEDIKPIIILSLILTSLTAYYTSILFVNYITKLIQQLDKQNKELIEKNNTIQQSIEEKQTLISIICHDIANPLSVIMYYSSKAEKQDDIATLKNESGKIYRSSQIVKNIIDDVRNLQALDSGKIELELESVDLSDVFNDIELIFIKRLEEKGLKLKYEIKSATPPKIIAEKRSLTYSVISNLISNAIKFSQRNDTITISVDKKGTKIQVSIRDHGIGMPESLIKNIFSHDKKTSRKGTEGEKGTGFGMPISKAFMEKYGGKIELESKEKIAESEEHGTTFHLFFNEAKGNEKHSGTKHI